MPQKAIRMSRAAVVGLAALVCVIIALAAFFSIRSIRTAGGYRMGVHFSTAAGIAPGAQVFFNGVNIGTVYKVIILPDTTVDVILDITRPTDIPKNAQFSAESRFTGSSEVHILAAPGSTAPPWPKRIEPLAAQPVGTTPMTLEEFFGQGKELGNRANRILAAARPYGPRLVHRLQSARSNASAAAGEMRAALPAMVGSLQSTLAQARGNVARAQQALRERDEPKLRAVADAFGRSSRDMAQVTASLGPIKRDPRVHANIRAAIANVRETTATLAKLSRDMENVTKNRQTKAELRDAGARFRDILSRLKHLI